MRMGTPYQEWLHRHAKAEEPPNVTTAGASGYFSAPASTRDPRLFDGDQIKPSVRRSLLSRLYEFWGPRYNSPLDWSTVWIAGSALGYQWNAARGGLGDLDVLIGVNLTKFLESNQEFWGLGEDAIAKHFNQEFANDLNPKTSNWNGFEVTWYVNPHASDIRAINPYAAYDLSHDRWTVRPEENPEREFPERWWQSVRAEIQRGRLIIDQWNDAKRAADAAQAGTPQWTNAMSRLRLATQQATALFDWIHSDRHAAFSRDGKGYADYYNFRWQAHKQAGTVPVLRAIKDIEKNTRVDVETDLHGVPVAPHKEALIDAMLWNTKYRSTAVQSSPSTPPTVVRDS